jgi:hypothetical protein
MLFIEKRMLARIFHTNHLRRPGSQMDAALDSHFDLDSMYTYSPASKCSSALPHQPSRSPRHDQYEISGLARIFHSNLLRKLESQMDTALISRSSSGSRDFIQPGIRILRSPCAISFCCLLVAIIIKYRGLWCNFKVIGL